ISARCTSEFRAISSTSATRSEPRSLSRYSATVLASILSGPAVGGTVRPRRRVTLRIRSISSWATWLSATFSPISRAWAGSSVSSMYAKSVRRVRRIGGTPGGRRGVYPYLGGGGGGFVHFFPHGHRGQLQSSAVPAF